MFQALCGPPVAIDGPRDDQLVQAGGDPPGIEVPQARQAALQV